MARKLIYPVGVPALILPDAKPKIWTVFIQGLLNYKFPFLWSGREGQKEEAVIKWFESENRRRKVAIYSIGGSGKISYLDQDKTLLGLEGNVNKKNLRSLIIHFPTDLQIYVHGKLFINKGRIIRWQTSQLF